MCCSIYNKLISIDPYLALYLAGKNITNQFPKMITLSRGSLKEIFERNLNANAATSHCWHEAKHTRISLYNKACPMCIQVVGVEFLSEFDTLLVKLFDGSLHKNAVVDKSMWHRLLVPNSSQKCEQTVQESNISAPSIQLGSIIILYEYAFEFVESFIGGGCDLHSPKQFTDRVLAAFNSVVVRDVGDGITAATSVMKMLNFAIIGHDENLACYSATYVLGKPTTSGIVVPPKQLPAYESTLHTFSSDTFNIVDTRGMQSSTVATRGKKPITIESLARLPIDSVDWSIRACVLRIGILKHFTNRNTGVAGLLQRVLFKDESGLVEALAYNDTIKMLNLANLKLNQTYFISNAKLGASQRPLQEWFSHFQTSAVEIKLYGATQIVDSSRFEDYGANDFTPQSLHFVPNAPSSRLFDDKDDTACFVQNEAAAFLAEQLKKIAHVPDIAQVSRRYVDNRIATIRDNSTNEQLTMTTNKSLSNGNNDQTCQPNVTYTNLKDIKYKLKKNDTVNTVGVLVSVGKCETNRSSIKVRRIVILDESLTKMSVAIWGDQAQNFCTQLDCILILQDVKVAYFNGVSLSIFRQSRIVEYSTMFFNKSAQMLKQWYDIHSGKIVPKAQTIVARGQNAEPKEEEEETKKLESFSTVKSP